MIITDIYYIGNTIRSSAIFTDIDDVETDPTSITAEWQIDDGAINKEYYNVGGQADTITKEVDGRFYFDIEGLVAGDYDVHWFGTGAVVASNPDTFKISSSRVL